MVVNRLNSLASGEGEAGAEADFGRIQTVAATGDTVLPGVSSFNTLGDVGTATRLDEPFAAGLVGSRSTRDDLSPWSRVDNTGLLPATPAPQRSVFDTWDAEDGDLEAALAAISQGAGGVDREAATDALLGDLFA